MRVSLLAGFGKDLLAQNDTGVGDLDATGLDGDVDELEQCVCLVFCEFYVHLLCVMSRNLL